MSAYNSNFKQEMPPKGGYSDIHYQRIPAQRLVGYKAAFFASALMTAYGMFYYTRRHKYINRMRNDYMNYLIAVEPLARAEQDRAYLRQIRHNRNVERDLMKNVPDWKVGTLWGKPVYNHTPADGLPNADIREFYAHRAYREITQFTRPNWEVGTEDNDCYGP